jgi:hypothetical protein
MVEESYVVTHEADQPDLVGDFLDTDALTGESLAQVDLLRPKTNAAAARDGEGAIMEGVLELRQAVVRAGR